MYYFLTYKGIIHYFTHSKISGFQVVIEFIVKGEQTTDIMFTKLCKYDIILWEFKEDLM